MKSLAGKYVKRCARQKDSVALDHRELERVVHGSEVAVVEY